MYLMTKKRKNFEILKINKTMYCLNYFKREIKNRTFEIFRKDIILINNHYYTFSNVYKFVKINDIIYKIRANTNLLSMMN